MLSFFKSRNWIFIVAVFIVLYVSTSFYCRNLLSESINMLIAVFMILFLVIKNWPVKVNLGQFIICTILCMLSLATSIFAGDDGKLMIHAVLVMYCAFFFTSIISFETFKNIFSQIMVVVCAFSSMVFILHSIIPEFVTVFPKIARGNFSIIPYYNLFLCVVPSLDIFFRAYGFFWEPGAFQTFINIAIIFTIFEIGKHRNSKLVVMFVALVLTYSTTGWLVGFINLVILIFVKYQNSGKNALVLMLLPVLAMGIAIGLTISPDNIDGISFGTAKIQSFAEGPSHGGITSASVRYDSIYYATVLFFKSPIIGSGFNGMTTMTQTMYHSMFTCTPLNYFAIYGFIYGVIVGFCIFHIARYLTSFNKVFFAILIFVSFLISVFSEQYVNYLITDIFIMYGAKIACERLVVGTKVTNV